MNLEHFFANVPFELFLLSVEEPGDVFLAYLVDEAVGAGAIQVIGARRCHCLEDGLREEFVLADNQALLF